MADLSGKSLGRYRLVERLGEGGMATVYKAFDTRLETDVAVKIIRTERLTEETRERALKRFEREAKALARLTHPNIVKVMDYGEHEGKPYLVMPHLAGGTLKSRLGKPIAWDEAFQILAPIARALEYAHQRDIIHRDVKPSNILVTDSGQPMISDFGVAKMLTLEETADLTGTGMGIGTPEYMAPEQWTGNATAHSDQYALGVMLYEMITGRKPYKADTPAAILLKQATEALPRPGIFAKDLPDGAERILVKLLARDTQDRYRDMGEVAKALEGGLKAGSDESRAKKPLLSKPKGRAADTLATMEDEETYNAPKRTGRVKTEKPAPQQHRTSLLPLYVILGLVVLALGVFMFDYYRNEGLPAASPPPASGQISTSPTAPPVESSPTPAAPSDEIVDDQGVTMRLVPAGSFTMGSNEYDDEKPPHEVYLDAFYMDIYEVTNARYEECVNSGACDPPQATSSYTRSSYYGDSQFAQYPVINVNWNQANAYCEWRGARLPAEAEWEKAARGTDERIYPWGDEFSCRKGNFDDETELDDYVVPGGPDCDGYDNTAPVGSYESGKSPYGIYDMAGNVWEWVSDWYDAYPGNTISNDSYGTTYKVLRGGSWGSYDISVRSSYRSWGVPAVTVSIVGFRCSRSLP